MEPAPTHPRAALSGFPLVMGILNVTPDSFSDGGDHLRLGDAVKHALAMVSEGADILDIGPESTRPGSRPVPEEEQLDRCIPVIKSIREVNNTTPISIDTRLATVAKAALQAGADIINDVSALRDDPEMAELAASTGAPVVLMHRRGDSETMQAGGGPDYDDVVAEIIKFLRERVTYAIASGIDASRIILDPGLGFGKRVEHNLQIMHKLKRFVDIGYPLLIGASRKRFMRGALGRDKSRSIDLKASARNVSKGVIGNRTEKETDDHKREVSNIPTGEAGSLACAAIAVMAGASIIRAHDVGPTVEVVRMCAAVRAAH